MNFSIAGTYILVVIISFLCSLVSFRQHGPFHLKLFSIFLGITALTEIIANFFLSRLHLQSNFPVYNIFILVEYPLLAFYFGKIISSSKFKKIIQVFSIFFPVLWFVIFLFVYRLSEWNTYGVMVGDLFVILFAARYLYELFTSDILINFWKHTGFWIAVGLIFYSCCELPIMGILNFLEHDWKITLRLLTLLQILNIIMYLVFTYAFLCQLKLTRKK